jgi:hypothetical protein
MLGISPLMIARFSLFGHRFLENRKSPSIENFVQGRTSTVREIDQDVIDEG